VEEARQVERELHVREIAADWGLEIVRSAQEAACDLIILPLPARGALGLSGDDWRDYVLNHAHCPVFLAARPVIPTDTTE
jgi:hypothetical protein